jgi:hypothetical protein
MARSFLLQSEREYKVRFATKILTKLGLLEEDLDYHFMPASMVIIFLFCGYQKWFDVRRSEHKQHFAASPYFSTRKPPITTLLDRRSRSNACA